MPNTSNVVSFPAEAALDVNGKTVAVLPEGGLKHLSEWSRDVAGALAATQGLELSADHWAVIEVMRNYYQTYNVSPVRKLLKRALRDAGQEALADDAVLDRLFPGDVRLQGARIAWMPSWSAGPMPIPSPRRRCPPSIPTAPPVISSAVSSSRARPSR